MSCLATGPEKDPARAARGLPVPPPPEAAEAAAPSAPSPQRSRQEERARGSFEV